MAKIIPFPHMKPDAGSARGGPLVVIGGHNYRIRPHSLAASVWRWVNW